MTKQLTQFASFNIVLALVYFFFMKEVITNNDTAAIAVTTPPCLALASATFYSVTTNAPCVLVCHSLTA
jgi:hypothetical protein